MIKTVDLTKKFGDNEVLTKLNVDVEQGEVISIIGPSGSGKSTFLRCLNGLETITDGHVYIDDFDIAGNELNIDKLREAWLQDNPKIFCFSNIFNFVQFCWAHKFTPYNSAVAYDAENDEMYLVEKEYENEFS